MNPEHTDGTITCRGASRLVCGARDVPLDAAEKAALTTHLAGCARCSIAARQFAELFRQLDECLARPGD